MNLRVAKSLRLAWGVMLGAALVFGTPWMRAARAQGGGQYEPTAEQAIKGFEMLSSGGRVQAAQRVQVEGELEVVYEDAPPRSGRLIYFLHAGGKRMPLHLGANPPANLRTGMRVRAGGVTDGETVTLDSGGSVTPLDSPAAAAALNSSGEHRVLVVLVNFQDKQTQPFTADYARQVAFDTTSGFFREASYGQTWLTGDVYGWFTIPVSSTTCDTSAIATHARQAAGAAGANLSAYNHYVYAFPGNVCSWAGRGTVGGSPSEAWINHWFQLGVVGHELGHNLGLFHSRSMDCGPTAVGGSCTTEEYGDTLDMMGAADTAHFNLFQKEQLGWVNYGASPPVQTVTASGTYWLDAYEPVGAGPKGLKVLKATDPATGKRTWYYVERRTAFGFDSFLSGNGNVLGGVVIHTGSEANGQANYLLDMTPATASWYDPALIVGQSFTDPDTGVVITAVSADSAGANVHVFLPPQPCAHANPTVTLTPGQSQWVAAGTTVNYTATVTNNDGGGCAASDFSLQAALPSGWVASFDAPTLSLSPGGSASTTLRVTSSASAPDGFYSVAATATGGGAYMATATSKYALVSALGVAVTTDRSRYTRSQTAVVTTTVTAAGSPVANASVTFTLTNSTGGVVTQNATTGADGKAVFRYSFNKRKDPTGTYQVRTSAAVNGVTGSGVASFSVAK